MGGYIVLLPDIAREDTDAFWAGRQAGCVWRQVDGVGFGGHGTVVYVPMLVSARFPHWANYPVKVTEANAARLYRYCASLLRELGFGVNVVFLWLVAGTCLTATNQANGLGILFLPCMLVVICAPTLHYITRMFMAR